MADFCTLAPSVYFNALEHKRPDFANPRNYQKQRIEFQKPNGGQETIVCDPQDDIRDLTFTVRNFEPLLNFYLDNRGKVFVYTNHYSVQSNAIFTKGFVIIENSDDCSYTMKVQIRCFP